MPQILAFLADAFASRFARPAACLAGPAQRLAAFRQQLTAKPGYARRSVRNRARWADGKRGP